MFQSGQSEDGAGRRSWEKEKLGFSRVLLLVTLDMQIDREVASFNLLFAPEEERGNRGGFSLGLRELQQYHHAQGFPSLSPHQITARSS